LLAQYNVIKCKAVLFEILVPINQCLRNEYKQTSGTNFCSEVAFNFSRRIFSGVAGNTVCSVLHDFARSAAALQSSTLASTRTFSLP